MLVISYRARVAISQCVYSQERFSLDRAWNPDYGLQPERYYLHAVNVQTGLSAYHYGVRLPGIVTGLQYDLDDSRPLAQH